MRVELLAIGLCFVCIGSSEAETIVLHIDPLTQNKEWRVFGDESRHHYLSLIETPQGGVAARPHPGDDPNGWGSTPYLNVHQGTGPIGGQIDEVTSQAQGVLVRASGSVPTPSGESNGHWWSEWTFSYDRPSRSVTGAGSTLISLLRPLAADGADLTVGHIASNRIRGPLLDGSFGETGDTSGGHGRSPDWAYAWDPIRDGSTFPQLSARQATIELLGNFNQIDGVSLGVGLIEPAYKPSITLGVEALTPSLEFITGGLYDRTFATDPFADNASLLAVVPQQFFSGQNLSFGYIYEARSIEVVPEPSSLLLAAFALVGAACVGGKRVLVAAVVCLVAGVVSSCASAGTVSLVGRLSAPTFGPHANYGADFDIDGAIGVFGAPGAKLDGIAAAGAVEVIDLPSGRSLATIKNPTRIGGESFGEGVDVSENFVAVTSWRAQVVGQENAGRVHVFRAPTGELVRTLTSPSPTRSGHFGKSLKIEGGRLFIGEPGFDSAAKSNNGAIHEFDLATGAYLRAYTDTELSSGARLGEVLEVSADHLYAGAPSNDSANVPFAGSMTVFNRAGGKLVTVDNPIIGEFERNFATAIASDGRRTVVGAAFDSATNGLGGGHAHLMDDATLELVGRLGHPSIYDDIELYGAAVALDGTLALVGVPGWYPSGSSIFTAEGSMDLFNVVTGAKLAHIANPDRERKASFGSEVYVSGNDLWASAPLAAGGEGAVYHFNYVPEPGTLTLAAIAICAGLLIRLRARWAGRR